MKDPTFGAVRAHLVTNCGCKFERRALFPDDDSEIFHFTRVLNGKTARIILPNYADDEVIVPAVCANICRALGINPGELDLLCDDGDRISIRVPPESEPGIIPS